MTAPAQIPDSIQATIHQDAINRVPAFFNATTPEILNELFQNSRRSKATTVTVTVEPDRITVSDDGEGIQDPSALLSFGQTVWDDATTQREHPAGMGLYSLARTDKVEITSKTRGNPAWQIDLEPGHFVGEMPAPVNVMPMDDSKPGTSITFSTKESEHIQYTQNSVKEAAKYYPIPVYVDGEMAETEDFMKAAIYTEEWEGIRIGAYRGNNYRQMNFHGVVVKEARLPIVDAIDFNWTTQAEVIDCPHLELTLPARKEVVENTFMEQLREACRRAIYRAMAEQPEPVDVPKAVWDDARRLGVKLPIASARLVPWQPDQANYDYYPSRMQRRPVDRDTVVMDAEMAPPDQQALARALENAGTMARFVDPNHKYQGYKWYDQLTRAEALHITLAQGGRVQDLKEIRENGNPFEDQRPDRITFTLDTLDKDRNRATISVPSDLAFENEEEEYMEDNRPLVTKDSTINAADLADLLKDSYFSPSDDFEADSHETQREEHEAAYEKTAITLLSSKEEALKTTLENALRKYVLYELPEDVTATITLTRGQPVRINLA